MVERKELEIVTDPKRLEEIRAIEKIKGDIFSIKEEFIDGYMADILGKLENVTVISNEDKKLEEAKLLLAEIQKDNIKEAKYIEDLLELIILPLEREESSTTINIGELQIKKTQNKSILKDFLIKEKEKLLGKIYDFLKSLDSGKKYNEGEDEEIQTNDKVKLEGEESDDENPLDKLIEEEDKKIFDIPSAEANHTIISRYLWENSEEEEFALSVDIIKKQLVNNLADSYKNELIGENEGFENYLMWREPLELVFQKTLGELYPYFEGSSLLAFTESRFEAKENNQYTAGGFFQILESTTKELKMKKHKHIDERKDPLRSAEGAATHLKSGFNRWYDRGLYRYHKDKIDYDKCIRHVIKKGETVGKISNRYHVTEDIIMDLNKLNPSNLKIGKEIIIPTQESYIISEEEREIIKENSVTLSFASYNGKIVEDIPEIASYDEYLEKFTELLKAVKKAGDSLVYVKYKTAFANINSEELNELFKEVIDIYQTINKDFFSGQYWTKRIKLLEKYIASDLPLEKKKSILISLIHDKEEDCTEKTVMGAEVNDYIKHSIHMKRWFTDILTQNLLYPANLWAMQKLESNITSGNDSVIKLKEEKEHIMDAVTFLSNIRGNKPITLYNISDLFNLDLQILKKMNPHIKKSVYNLGLALPITIYLPQGIDYNVDIYLYNTEIKPLYRREITIDKTKIKREKRDFHEIRTEYRYKKFSYTIRSYDSIYDIIADFEKNKLKVMKIMDEKGKTIKTHISPGERITIITQTLKK